MDCFAYYKKMIDKPSPSSSKRSLTGLTLLGTKQGHRRNHKFLTGFTLVEIMVVVAIVVVLATLAISLMLRNRITTNEAIAIAGLRTISSACQSYYATTIPHLYPDSLATLGPEQSEPPYIDSALASSSRSGYDYTYQPGVDGASFILRAEPVVYRRTGNRYFYTDETGKTTAKEGESAGPGDPAI